MAFNNINLDNSESSAAEDDTQSSEERNVRIFAKQMLQGRLFLGYFQERRLVNPLQSYRDVIFIHDSEIKLKHDLNIVRKRLKNFYKHDKWIGITEPSTVGVPNGYCLWVESNIDTFGNYWYKIKSISFRKQEILLKVKVIRPMTNVETEVENNINKNESFEELLENYKNSFKENTMWVLNDILTAQNIKQSIIFISVLVFTLVTYIVYGLQFLMEFMLRFIREMSVFVQASTPVMIAVVNVFGKIIGGFYILIAMLFRKESNLPSQQRMVYYQSRPRAIEMGGQGARFRQNAPNYVTNDPLTITEIE